LSRIHWRRAAIRALLAAIPLLFLAPLSLGGGSSQTLDRLENYLYDLRARLLQPNGVDSKVVVVEQDDSRSWTHAQLATLVDQLFNKYGARLVAFDAPFPDKDEASALSLIKDLQPLAESDPRLQSRLDAALQQYESDRRFAGSMTGHDVVLGFVFKPTASKDAAATAGSLPQPVQIDARAVETVPWIEARAFVGNLPELQSSAATAGFVDAPLRDPDGAVRRMPLLQRYHGQLYESLALATLRASLGQPPIKLGFVGGEARGARLKNIQIGDLRIPTDESGALLIPLRDHAKISATQVLQGEAKSDLFKHAFVLVGAAADAQAQIIAGILDQGVLSRPYWSQAFELGVLILFALFAAFVFPRLAPVAQLVGVAALASALITLNLWVWARAAFVLPLAGPLVGLLASAALVLSYAYFIETRRKRRLSRVFGRYVPPEMVNELDMANAEVSLEGESREMSVLFSDVRGFTTLSEGFSPRELTRLMNDVLTPLTDVIQQKRGTLDKYMGDAIMAFWGAPLFDPNHAPRAVEAALQMVECTKRLAADFASRGWPEIHIGVGISSGLMNVGNMGSQYRMAYTVLGDTVNLGSRLESLTSRYGVDIIVSGATAKLCPDLAFRELDLVKVKGKNAPVAIYEPLGPRSSIPAAHVTRLEAFSEMLRLYRSRHFSGAQELVHTLAAEREEPLLLLYKQRIAHFLAEPPPGSWDGVFIHQTK
jgi:adenylate cyclase